MRVLWKQNALETMHSVSVELLKMKKVNALLLAKATLLVILWRQNAWFQILHFVA